jgi:hypothetical protein
MEIPFYVEGDTRRRTPGTKCSNRPPEATSLASIAENGASRRIPWAIVLNDT